MVRTYLIASEVNHDSTQSIDSMKGKVFTKWAWLYEFFENFEN